jgi:hypothetical protein
MAVSVKYPADPFAHTLQGLCVPIQECRAGTAVSEDAATPDWG